MCHCSVFNDVRGEIPPLFSNDEAVVNARFKNQETKREVVGQYTAIKFINLESSVYVLFSTITSSCSSQSMATK